MCNMVQNLEVLRQVHIDIAHYVCKLKHSYHSRNEQQQEQCTELRFSLEDLYQ
jgi:hypothetical protein